MGTLELETALVGRFNVSNVLAALGAYAAVTLLRASRREAALVDLGYGTYVIDALRAAGRGYTARRLP